MSTDGPLRNHEKGPVARQILRQNSSATDTTSINTDIQSGLTKVNTLITTLEPALGVAAHGEGKHQGEDAQYDGELRAFESVEERIEQWRVDVQSPSSVIESNGFRYQVTVNSIEELLNFLFSVLVVEDTTAKDDLDVAFFAICLGKFLISQHHGKQTQTSTAEQKIMREIAEVVENIKVLLTRHKAV